MTHRAWNGRVVGAVIVSSLVALAAAGCSSHSSKKWKYDFEIRKVTIETEPAGASVYQVSTADGAKTLLGMTPIREQSVAVTTGAKFKSVSPGEMQRIISQVEMVHVRIEKPGYQPYEGNLSTERGKVKAHSLKLEPTTQTAGR